MKSTAIVITSTEKVELHSYDVEPLKPNEMLVRTEYSGVSQGTEIWAYLNKRPELSFPTVPGYQAVGVIDKLGADVADYRVGQQVFFGTSRLPDSFPPAWMGCHVSRAVVGRATPVPEQADPIASAFAALPAVSIRGIRMLDIRIGDLVVVTGQGLIGQASAQLARLRGATVIASDLSPRRRRLSEQYSADVAIDGSGCALEQAVRSLRPGGADVVIETTGRSDMFSRCIDLLRCEGQLLLQGWYPEPISFDFHATHTKRPKIAVTCSTDDPDMCLDLIARNRIHMRELVTHVVSPCDAPEHYARLAVGDADYLGVAFDWKEFQ